MGLIESISCKRLQHVEYFFSVLFSISFLDSSSLKLYKLLCQGFHLLFTHDSSQDICFTKSISCDDLSCLHNLFLIYDYSISSLQYRFQGRVRVCDWCSSPFGVDVLRNKLHRTRSIEGVESNQLFYSAWLGLFQNILHTCRFKLEDTRTVTTLEHIEGVFIKLIDFVDVKVRILLVDEVNRMLDECKGLQPQEVHLYQAALLYLVHGVLGSDGVGLGIVA